MKFLFTLSTLLLLLHNLPPALAQGEDNIWMFGTGYFVDFSSGSAQLPANPPRGQSNRNFPGYFVQPESSLSASVSDAAGNLRFFTALRNVGSPADLKKYYEEEPKVFDATGYSMPNGNIRAMREESADNPLIIQWPGQDDKYFLIYPTNSGLMYSIVDMRLNNGLGDVDVSHKDILFHPFRSVVASQITAVNGCSGVWLIARASGKYGFYRFLIDQNGLHPDAVFVETPSPAPLNDYGRNGRLSVSPDGKRLALSLHKGTEIYDFEKCSGNISNPRIIDTIFSYGNCFSPDGSKLYVSGMSFYQGGIYCDGIMYLGGRSIVFQYDLNQGNPAAITQSKTPVLEHPLFACLSFFDCCASRPCHQNGTCFCDTIGHFIGDLRLGPDDRIYMINNGKACSTGDTISPIFPMPYTTRYVDSHALHVIRKPNNPGLACDPQIYHVMVAKGYQSPQAGIRLPHKPMIHPGLPDTLPGNSYTLSACFEDSFVLSTAPEGTCPRWDDSSTQRQRTVYRPGTYFVGYNLDNCGWKTDTFHVRFPRMPEISTQQAFSCTNDPKGILDVRPRSGDTADFTYIWTGPQGLISGASQSISNLYPGSYTLRIQTPHGCDTTIDIRVQALKGASAFFEADSVICPEIPVQIYRTDPEPYQEWHSGTGSLAANTGDPAFTYAARGSYTLTRITENIQGCRDSFTQQLRVPDLNLVLLADKPFAHRAEAIMLYTQADEPYRITSWLPENKFPSQQSTHQTFRTNQELVITVTAISGYGCPDTASLRIRLHPLIDFPNAFTPNGDGKNDRFRPIIKGGKAEILAFRIFDRWGNLVWEQQGGETLSGWDGYKDGAPALAGTYFYHIQLKTDTGLLTEQKGDLGLIR